MPHNSEMKSHQARHETTPPKKALLDSSKSRIGSEAFLIASKPNSWQPKPKESPHLNKSFENMPLERSHTSLMCYE